MNIQLGNYNTQNIILLHICNNNLYLKKYNL